MSENDRVRLCAQCGRDYRERANIGRLQCRMHPDPAVVDAFGRIRCCGYKLGDGGVLYSSVVTLDDAAGCLKCDHYEKAGPSILEAPVVTMPALLVARQVVMEPPADQIVAYIDSARVREWATRHGDDRGKMVYAVGMPMDRPAHEVDIKGCAFRILGEFVRSPYYDWTRYPECAEPRARFEEHVKNHLGSSVWDTGFDADPNAHTFGINTVDDDEEGRTMPKREKAHTPGARFQAVMNMQRSGSLRLLAQVMVPFYIVRRVAAAQEESTLDHFRFYNARETTTWEQDQWAFNAS